MLTRNADISDPCLLCWDSRLVGVALMSLKCRCVGRRAKPNGWDITRNPSKITAGIQQV